MINILWDCLELAKNLGNDLGKNVSGFTIPARDTIILKMATGVKFLLTYNNRQERNLVVLSAWENGWQVIATCDDYGGLLNTLLIW